MTVSRPRGYAGQPEAEKRDQRILDYLIEFGPSSRNDLAAYLGLERTPRLVSYALHRLRFRGMVSHMAQGNEGHGVWVVTEKAMHQRSEQ